jgi:hypothetical protein
VVSAQGGGEVMTVLTFRCDRCGAQKPEDCHCGAADVLMAAMEKMTEPLPKPAEIFDFAREHAKRQRHQVFFEFTEDREW